VQAARDLARDEPLHDQRLARRARRCRAHFVDADAAADDERMAAYVSQLQVQNEATAQQAQQAQSDYQHLQSFADKRDTEARQEREQLRAEVARLSSVIASGQQQAAPQAQPEAGGYYNEDLYDNLAAPSPPSAAQPQADPAVTAELAVLREKVAAQEVVQSQSLQAQQAQEARAQAYALRDKLVADLSMSVAEAEAAVVFRHQGDVDTYADMLSTAKSRMVRQRITTREDAQETEQAVAGGSNRSTGRTRTVDDLGSDIQPLTADDLAGLTDPEKGTRRQDKWMELAGFTS